MRKWVIVGLVWVATAACASSGRFSAITVSNILSVHEEYNIIEPGVFRYHSNKLLPYFKSLVKAAHKRGLKVYAVDNLDDVMVEAGLKTPSEKNTKLYGYNTGRGSILLDSALAPDEAFQILVHEIGHTLQPRELDETEEGQVFAEALAVIVCKELGLDVTRYAFPYIHTFENRHKVLQRYSKEIDKAAKELVADIRGGV